MGALGSNDRGCELCVNRLAMRCVAARRGSLASVCGRPAGRPDGRELIKAFLMDALDPVKKLTLRKKEQAKKRKRNQRNFQTLRLNDDREFVRA